MATTLSTLGSWQEPLPLRMDLAEIMDELEPGWSAWRPGGDASPAE